MALGRKLVGSCSPLGSQILRDGREGGREGGREREKERERVLVQSFVPNSANKSTQRSRYCTPALRPTSSMLSLVLVGQRQA